MASFSQPAVIASSAQVSANAIEQSDLADDAVGLPELDAGTPGALITYDASGDPVEIASGTDGFVLTAKGAGVVPEWELAGLDAVTTLIPLPAFPYFRIVTLGGAFNNNTQFLLGRYVVPVKTAITSISFYVTSKSTNGTAKIACYTEDGQTKVFEVTTSTITSAGVKTTAASATLEAGVYYFGLVADGTLNCEYAVYDSIDAGGVDLRTTLFNGVGSQPKMSGREDITAFTPPATIDPTAIDSLEKMAAVIRLDS